MARTKQDKSKGKRKRLAVDSGDDDDAGADDAAQDKGSSSKKTAAKKGAKQDDRTHCWDAMRHMDIAEEVRYSCL